jgi:hypothetical protein
MKVFERRSAVSHTASAQTVSVADNLVLNAGRIADETILDCLTESRAFWTAFRRRQLERLENEYPGYREELNRRRALAGLPPL